MAIGRISGPMLKPNLERQGVDLAFDTDLLYLDVTNGRIGIKNSAPTVALEVTGSGKFSNNLTVLGLTNLGNLRLSNNTIEALNLDGNVYVSANGDGIVELSPDVRITGNLTVEGNTIVNSQTVSITDAVINIGTAPNLGPLTVDDGYDRGIQFHYYDTQDRHSFFGQKHDRKYYILDDATSVSGVYSGTPGDLVLGNLTASNVDVSTISLGNLAVNNNEIYATNTNGDIEITPNGTGDIILGGNVGINSVSPVDYPLVVNGTTGMQIPVGDTSQRPSSLTVDPGVIRLNTDTGDFEGWNGFDWVNFSQAGLSGAWTSTIFTGDGTTTSFPLTGSPTTNTILVNIEGTFQLPGFSYTVIDADLVFTEAVPDGSRVEVRQFNVIGESVSEIATLYHENLDTSLTIIDFWPLASFRSADYIIQVDNGAGQYQKSNVSLIHNGTTVFMNEYGLIHTGASPIATLSAYIALGQVRLRAQAVSGSANMVTMTRILLPV